MNQPKIAIIGAGVSGLTLGRLLPGSTIYEKSPFIGGLSRTLHYKGFHFDTGLHWLPSLDSEVQAFLEPFMGNGVSRVPFSSGATALLKNGCFLQNAYHPLDFPFKENPVLALHLRAGYYWRQVFPKSGTSLESRLINAQGDAYYKIFSKGLIEKFFGTPPDQMYPPTFQLKKRESLLPRFIRWIRRGGRRPSAPKKDPEIPYPLPWFGVIVEKLAEGLDIRLSSELTQIHLSGKEVVGIQINQQEQISCERLILTLPLQFWVHLLNPPPQIIKEAQAIRYRDLIYAVLFFETEQAMGEFLVTAMGKEIFVRALEPKNWSKAVAPPHQTSVCFEIPCFRGDSLWQTPDGEILRKVFEDFRRYYEVPAPFDGIVFRIPRFRPIFDKALESRLKNLREFASSFKNVYFPSDDLFFLGSNVNTAVKEAIRIAKGMAHALPHTSNRIY